ERQSVGPAGALDAPAAGAEPAAEVIGRMGAFEDGHDVGVGLDNAVVRQEGAGSGLAAVVAPPAAVPVGELKDLTETAIPLPTRVSGPDQTGHDLPHSTTISHLLSLDILPLRECKGAGARAHG